PFLVVKSCERWSARHTCKRKHRPNENVGPKQRRELLIADRLSLHRHDRKAGRTEEVKYAGHYKDHGEEAEVRRIKKPRHDCHIAQAQRHICDLAANLGQSALNSFFLQIFQRPPVNERKPPLIGAASLVSTRTPAKNSAPNQSLACPPLRCRSKRDGRCRR